MNLAKYLAALLDDGYSEASVIRMVTRDIADAVADPSRCGHVGLDLGNGETMRCRLDVGHRGTHEWRRSALRR